MKDFVIMLLVVCCSLPVLAQPDTLWTRHYGGHNADEATAVQPTADGGFIFTGYMQTVQNGMDVYVVKTDSQGTVVWQRPYGGIAGDRGEAVVQLPDGSHALAGYRGVYATGRIQSYLVRLAANGDTILTRGYADAMDNFANDLTPATDSGFVMVGGVGSSNLRAIAVNPDGSLRWTRDFGLSCGHAVEALPDGSYAAFG